jgi:glycolate oxidase iron-sulfur subunit
MSENASPPSIDPRRRLLELTDACVLCGLCLPHCPTYRLDAVETESPRGRIMLAQAQAAGDGVLDASSQLALDHCLGCGRCEHVCPAKVRYGEILRLSRALSPPAARPLSVRALRWASRHPRLFARMLQLARPLRALAPQPLRSALAATTKDPNRPMAERRAEPRSARLGLLGGCVAQALDVDVANAARRVLLASGHELIEPPRQACCGALPAHEGDPASARREAESNRALWSPLAPTRLLTTASGCHAAFAAGLGGIAPVQDILGFLASDAGFLRLPLQSLDERVALHLPCTQRASAESVAAARSLLQRLPGIAWIELADTGCCGAAGAHSLRFPQRAAALRSPLVDAALRSGATTLLTANIGCRLHLQATDALAHLRILHPVQLLAEALP